MKRALLLLLLTACMRRLPPVEAPERVVPVARAPSAAPAPGVGRVLVGTDPQTARVEEEVGHIRGRVEYRTLCTRTPCVVDLPYGLHLLRFTGVKDPLRGGEGDLNVVEGTTAYRYALGHTEYRTGIWLGAAVALAVGFGGLVFGTAFAIAGARPNPVTHTTPYPLELPVGIAVGGAALIALAGILIGLFPGEVQNGTASTWQL